MTNRTTIYLPDEYKELLNDISAYTGLNKSEIIRRAIDQVDLVPQSFKEDSKLELYQKKKFI